MSERICIWIAWRLPRGVVKWTFYRVLANATSGQHSNQDAVALTWQQAADRWEAEMTLA